jgi:hypothetical protein
VTDWINDWHDYNAALRAHTDFRRFLATHYDELSRGWVLDRLSRYGAEAAAPSAVAYEHMIDDTVNADACWMSLEMMDLVQRAMVDFDMTEEFTLDDAFIPHGFMVLPEPFYSLDVNNKRCAERAYMWRIDHHGVVKVAEGEGGLHYTYDLRQDGETMPVVRITTISHMLDIDDFQNPDDAYVIACRARGIQWGIVHATTIPLFLVSSTKDVSNEGDPGVGWLRFWRVAQKLMGERIVTSERRQAARPFRREAQRHGFDPAAPRVIELRRPTDRDVDAEGERIRDVNWTHRWIVGGHWRNQWFPSEGRHKQIYIGAYEKGPKDLPLVIRDRVWNWDR